MGIDGFYSRVERFERACDTRQQEAIERAIEDYRDYVGSLKDAYEFVRERYPEIPTVASLKGSAFELLLYLPVPDCRD